MKKLFKQTVLVFNEVITPLVYFIGFGLLSLIMFKTILISSILLMFPALVSLLQLYVGIVGLFKKHVSVYGEWLYTKYNKPPAGVDLLGYSKKWINEDFTPNGIRLFSYSEDDDIYTSTHWNGCHDTYLSCHTSKPEYWMRINNPPKVK